MLTLTDDDVVPPAPVQARVNVVAEVIAAVVVCPLAAWLPLHPPEPMHPVAF